MRYRPDHATFRPTCANFQVKRKDSESVDTVYNPRSITGEKNTKQFGFWGHINKVSGSYFSAHRRTLGSAIQSLRSSGKLSIEERRKATEPRPKVKRTPHSLTWYSQPHSPPAVRPSYGGTCRR